jgi:hypothetical protein
MMGLNYCTQNQNDVDDVFKIEFSTELHLYNIESTWSKS